MQSFHNDVAVKQKYLDRVLAHQKADNLIRGTGWEAGKGCAVGCTLENYDHSRYPVELGIPEWIARVEDTLFEGMSLEKSKTWPHDFLNAIPLGITEQQFELQIKAPFLILVLESELTTFDHAKFPNVKTAIDDSIALWKRGDIGSDNWSLAAARVVERVALAAGAAWEAARAARAAWAAARAARAALAAGEAWAPREAARAAWAAGEARHDYFADELLRLLSELQPAVGE